MVEKITVKLKNNDGQIFCSPHLLKLIREKFSVTNPSYQMRRFSPRKYVITPSGVFSPGLWEQITYYLNSLQIPIKLDVDPEFQKKIKPTTFANYEIENIEGFTYYQHQLDLIKEFLTNGRGIGLAATSAGKSLSIAGLVRTVIKYNPNFKILIIVPNVGLLNQLYSSFIGEFNLPVITRWGDGYTPDLSKNVIVANSQILISDIPSTLKVVKDFDMLIVDEVHTLGERKNQINKVVHNMPTNYKFGLTGTLPDNNLAIWNVLGKIGPVLYEETSYNIRKKGVAAEVKINVIFCKHTDSPEEPSEDEKHQPTARYNKEREFLYKKPERNRIVEKIAEKVKGNVLILVDLIDHGLILKDSLSNLTDKNVCFVQGETDTEERENIIKRMEQTNNNVCIAMSKIFSTGISIKNLPFVVFSCIGKSAVRISQSIGRAMRLHENKEIAVIYDIADDTEYSQSHLLQRLKLYSKQKIPFEIKKITI